MCHPSEGKTSSSCVHFQNVLAESCFELLAQILAYLKINKGRRSDGKFHLRQNIQDKKNGVFLQVVASIKQIQHKDRNMEPSTSLSTTQSKEENPAFSSSQFCHLSPSPF